jgi:multidrug efflux system membrane fusion protein
MTTKNISKLKITLAGLALLAVGGLLVPSAIKRLTPSSSAAIMPNAPAGVPATTVKVAQENVPIFLNGVGTAQALATVTMRTRVDGQLDKVNFTEGQDVKAGQVLAQLDARTFAAQLAQVVAQKARDEAQLDNAKLDLQRYSTLIKVDATTQQALDTQRALVNQLIAAVETDKAQINYAKVQVDFTTITAPLSGRIGARLVDPGNIVHATDANGLVVINQVDPISVVFTLPESAFQDINHALRPGLQLPVYAYARDSDQVLSKGALVLLNNQIDTTTGTVQLKAHFPNPTHTLWPGQYINVSLQLGTREHALTVPAAVVQRSQTGTYVYVVKPDESVEIRPVNVIQMQDGKAVIDQGLSANERVVLDGQYKLKPGIHIVEKALAAAQPENTKATGSAK